MSIYIHGFVIAMADYQFHPEVNDPVVQLRRAMDNMDGKSRHGIAERVEHSCPFSGGTQ
jgi:hypothetical protein